MLLLSIQCEGNGIGLACFRTPPRSWKSAKFCTILNLFLGGAHCNALCMSTCGETPQFITNSYEAALLRKPPFGVQLRRQEARVHASKTLETNTLPTVEAVHLLLMSEIGHWLPKTAGLSRDSKENLHFWLDLWESRWLGVIKVWFLVASHQAN